MTITSPSPRYWFQDFPVGREIALGPLTLTRESVVAFARDFDPQPFHLDDAAAEASLFGALSASGWHTCALVNRMLCDAFILQSAGLGSPGIDNIKWIKPVYPGDVLSGRTVVLDARLMKSRAGVGLVHFRTEIANQNSEPVLTMEAWIMLRARAEA